MGLDPGRYKSHIVGDADERPFGSMESQMPDDERFKDCDPLLVRCRNCEGQMPFSPVAERHVRPLHCLHNINR